MALMGFPNVRPLSSSVPRFLTVVLVPSPFVLRNVAILAHSAVLPNKIPFFFLDSIAGSFVSSTYLFGLSSCGVSQEDPDQGMTGLGRVVYPLHSCDNQITPMVGVSDAEV